MGHPVFENFLLSEISDGNNDFTFAITDFAVGFVMGRGGSVIKTIQVGF